MRLQTLQSREGGLAGGAREGLATGSHVELQVAGGSELCFAGGAGQGPGSVHLLVVLLQQLRGLEVGLLVKIGYVVLALHHGAEESGRERSHGRRLFEKNILTD